MVLAKDLHQKIQDMQIKINGSVRVAHLEREITTLTDAVHLLVSKLEKPIEEENTPDPYKDEKGKVKKIDRKSIPEDENEKWREYLDDNDELDGDKILAEDDEEEEPEGDQEGEDEEEDDEEQEDDDDYEDEDEEDDQIEEQENIDQEPELASQVWEKKDLKELSGYKADKEKAINGVAYKWTERDDLLSESFTVISKRVIFVKNKYNYSDLEHIEYLDIKCKNKFKYKKLVQLLRLILDIANKEHTLQKPIHFFISNTKYEFNNRAKYVVDNLITFFKKVSKLKDSRFSDK